MEQMELKEIVDQVDDREAAKRHKKALEHRWFFGYYLHCKDPAKKAKLIDQYNRLARQHE